MPVLIIMLAAYLSREVVMLIVGILVLLKFIARQRRSNLEMRYDKDSKLFKEFVEKTNIADIKYEPHIFAPTAFL